MTANEEYNFGQVVAELKGQIDLVNQKIGSIDSALSDLKRGMCARIEDHSNRIPVVESQVSDVRKMGWALLMVLFGQAVAYFWSK